jgi:hypothetical protein
VFVCCLAALSHKGPANSQHSGRKHTTLPISASSVNNIIRVIGDSLALYLVQPYVGHDSSEKQRVARHIGYPPNAA